MIKKKHFKKIKIRINVPGRRMPLLILMPEGDGKNRPGVLWLHGGGYITGMKEMALFSRARDLAEKHGSVVISPGYRKSLRAPCPAAFDDCWAALLWMKENAENCGIDPGRLMVGGESAGGGLAAAVCMKARDTGEVEIAFQMPLYPMLDDRDTPSSKDNHGRVWNTRRNRFAWRIYLRGIKSGEISPYAAPARQTEYTGLPPCYTFVGDGEPFYCETLEYVKALQKAGIEAEADVYHTDMHAFDMMRPGLDISRRAADRFGEHFEYAVKNYYAPQRNKERQYEGKNGNS